MKYFKRLKCWKNYKGSCYVDEKTMNAYSYDWYELGKYFTIDGRQTYVVNAYRYSVQTSKHINKLTNLLNQIGISYLTIDAPEGLQNLEIALEYNLREKAKLMVAEKYGRALRDYSWVNKNLILLQKLGKLATNKTLKIHIEAVEEQRTKRLIWVREQRAKFRAAYLQSKPGFDHQLTNVVNK